MRLVVLTAALVLVYSGTALAQRSHSTPAPPSAAPRPAPAAPGRSTPAPERRSTMTFRDRPIALATPGPFRRSVRTVMLPGVPFFWGWGGPAFYVDATPAPAVPISDGPKGGLQLDVQPWRAQVYVDGVLVGRVEDFKGYYQHLEMSAGPHQITIVDTGYQPLVFDVVVTPGRTATYRGTLNEASVR
jgi:hypothetical protein